jgi:AbrB family looped-hinge helix DNA binding protein
VRAIAAKVTSKGQITIPQEVRKRLGLQAGDRVVFRLEEPGDQATPTIEADGGVTRARVGRIPDLIALAGSMRPPSKRSGQSWPQIRARAWDEEIRKRR